MTLSTSPTLAVLHDLFTSANDLQSFRSNAGSFLTAHEVPKNARSRDILLTVPRNGSLTPDNVKELVSIVVDQDTRAGGTGPTTTSNQSMPLLSAFYDKYIIGKEVPWGSYVDVKAALIEELEGSAIVW